MNPLSTAGNCRLVSLALLAGLIGMTAANAQDEAATSAVNINDALIDVYIETRTQQPASRIMPENREILTSELVDLYLLSVQPQAEVLSQDPRIQAQLELQERGILANLVANDFLQRNQASEQEILDEYAKQIQLAPPLDFKARHILVETQALANELIGRLETGEDFQALAREFSSDSSAQQGGDLGWFSPDRMVKPFSDAVVALEDGTFTREPVQSQFGWHVILREDSRDAEPPTLDSVKDVIKQRIEQQKLRDYVVSLREANSE